MQKFGRDYLDRLDSLIEAHRAGQEIDLERLSQESVVGLLNVFDEYLYTTWMHMGDTTFNRTGYRNSTDFVLEHLRARK